MKTIPAEEPQRATAIGKPPSLHLSQSTGHIVGKLISYAILVLGALVMIFPLFWMLSASFKPEWQILTTPPIWIPSEWEQVSAGDTAKEFPLWYATAPDGSESKVFEIGARRYTTVADVTRIEGLVSVPATELGDPTPTTVDGVSLNVRAWTTGGESRRVVALARDGDNLVVAPVESLAGLADRRPLDEVNARDRANVEFDDVRFTGRAADEEGGVLVQVGPETQLDVVAPRGVAEAAFLTAEDAPIEPEFFPIGNTELQLYHLKDHPQDEWYVLLSLEAWQPIIDLDELQTDSFSVSADQLTGETTSHVFGDVSMPVNTVALDDGTTQEVIVIDHLEDRVLVIPTEGIETMRLAPVSNNLGDPFVQRINTFPVRYIDDYAQGRDQISVALIGERQTKALVAPQAAIANVFDVPGRSLERVLHVRLRYENYTEAMSKNLGGATFFTFFKNSGIVVGLNLIGHYFSVILVAYAFARLRAPGKDVLFIILLSTMMLPFPVLLIPTYEIFNTFGMLNTLWPLFIRSFFGNAFLIFLLRQFFMSIPRELEEAAVIDGANTLQVLWSVILPLSKPALATIGIFTFWWNWNAFLEPFVYINSVKNFTVSLGLAFFKGQYVYNFHWLMAAGMVAIIPMILIFFFAQRYFIEGIQMSGLKG
ncbi:carbohydrate ABC transporter permease [Aggregatilinea lenta]|uniref:carbohydrate ABC transporter permease n=1 Tax=Aggregatilinea lenta TaxID=913108 RepID=UPI000E5AB9BB|nr:carbohydrate ABC transporter permease [Aggregatilinea lenta]